MSKPILLDTSPLGKLAHPKAKPDIIEWLRDILAKGAQVVIPEIADYEVRRSFILHDLTEAINRLDELETALPFLLLNTSTMSKAAQLWADIRKQGKPTADPQALDGDVILAAQALEIGGIVATENVGHLTRFVEAKHWQDIIL